MGRDKRNEARNEHFTKMLRSTMEEPAWQALSSSAQALYPWLKLEWRGDHNNNNGRLMLSVRQAANRMGVSNNTVTKAFMDLQAKGFVIVTEIAHLGIGAKAKGHRFELTELATPTGGHSGSKLYRQWRKGHDFEVKRAAVHNAHGPSGKPKPCLNFCDVTVSNLKTQHDLASQK